MLHQRGLTRLPGRHQPFSAQAEILLTVCRGDPPPLPASSWLTIQGYRDRWKRFIGGAKSMYTLAKCRKYVPGFSLPGFKADVLRIYEDACSGIARGDRTLLRQVTSACTMRRLLEGRSSEVHNVSHALCTCPAVHIRLSHGRKS